MIEFGYWPIRYQGDVIRWLMNYLELEYAEYNPKSQEDWYVYKKDAIGLSFTSLPYLIDGDIKMTDYRAIPYYVVQVGQRPEMLGKDMHDRAVVNMIEGVLEDLRKNLWKVAFRGDNHRASMQKILNYKSPSLRKLAQLSKFLDKKQFFLGYVTICDFTFAAGIDLLSMMATSLDLKCPFKEFTNLIDLAKRVRQLPGVEEFIEKNKSMPLMHNTMMPYPFIDNKFFN